MTTHNSDLSKAKYILTACASRSRWDLLAFYILASDLLSLHLHPNNQTKTTFASKRSNKTTFGSNNQIKLLAKDRYSVHPAQRGISLHFIFSIFFHNIGFQPKGNLLLFCLKSDPSIQKCLKS